MKALGYLLLIPASIGNTIFRGWVFTVLWGWFIVSQFSQMPHLTIVAGLGLVLTVGLLRSPSLTDKETLEIMNTIDNRPKISLSGRWVQAGSYAVVSILSLFFGWIYHSFM